MLILAGCATTPEEEAAPDPETLGATDRVLHYREALRQTPDQPELYYRLGNALLDMGRFQDAYSAYQQAVTLKPDYADAYSNLGLTLRKLGNLKAAAGAYASALDLKPDDVTTLTNLAVVAQLLEDGEQVAWCLERLATLRPEDNAVVEGYADALYGLGRPAEALQHYLILAERNAGRPRNLFQAGLCYFDLGRFAEAAATWETALTLDPENESIHRNLTVAWLEAGDPAAARAAAARCAERGIALDPELLRQIADGAP